MRTMKVLSGISGIALLISLGSLESVGNWWLLAIALGLISIAVLFFTCSRLGYFYPRKEHRDNGGGGKVLWIRDATPSKSSEPERSEKGRGLVATARSSR